MASNRPGQKSTVRIIGGLWRGRKLQFHTTPGLRPSPDRVRETLFNWLSGVIANAHCLDLFAGSGALGLEALSRGAASCLMLDTSQRSCTDINAHLQSLGSSGGRCLHANAVDFLERGRSGARAMDIVFLDPPFGLGFLEPVSELLEAREWLAPQARIYLESGRRDNAPKKLPSNWHLHRDKTAGEVRFQLFVRQPSC
jgi:16S rRNA (guanine966-N2)-methyltransferase